MVPNEWRDAEDVSALSVAIVLCRRGLAVRCDMEHDDSLLRAASALST
jgi:hypothetical protein